MEQKDFKILNETLKKMQTQMDALKYYIYKIRSKEENVRLSKIVIADMDIMFNTKIKDFQKKMIDHIKEETKNENFAMLSKINSPDEESIKRIGKIFGIKNAFLNQVIKTASEKGLKKEGKLDAR
jgi:hypothetical protein